jgi:cation:H+ antiporter
MVAGELLTQIIIGVLGLAAMIWSAEFVVKRAIGLAHHYGVSESFVGLTILSIGTSLPEIASHVIASLGILNGTLDYKIQSGLVLGANIGSDVVQQTLVVGLVVLMGGSLVFSKKFLKQSYGMMVGTTLLCIVLGWDGTYSRIDGFILLSIFAGYMYWLYTDERAQEHLKPQHDSLKYSPKKTVLFLLLGLCGLIGASAMVLHVMETHVAVTVLGGSLLGVITLGIASALPEMLTAISGVKNKSSGVSVGTLIGSNITNPLVAIGLGAAISTYYVPRPLVYWDLPMETVTGLALLLLLLFGDRKLGKKEAIALILIYFVYLYVRWQYFAID